MSAAQGGADADKDEHRFLIDSFFSLGAMLYDACSPSMPFFIWAFFTELFYFILLGLRRPGKGLSHAFLSLLLSIAQPTRL